MHKAEEGKSTMDDVHGEPQVFLYMDIPVPFCLPWRDTCNMGHRVPHVDAGKSHSSSIHVNMEEDLN